MLEIKYFEKKREKKKKQEKEAEQWPGPAAANSFAWKYKGCVQTTEEIVAIQVKLNIVRAGCKNEL